MKVMLPLPVIIRFYDLNSPKETIRGIKKSRTFTMFMGYIYYTKVLPPKTLIANGHPWVQENYIMGMI
ncbi:hypothetical protein GGR15_001424 [Butyricimonas paravirosa]|uniref:Uncharacterized protein n=1 Tax=Butyricimonas paravirosa TaxID=1472417 RepID=A0A7X5YAX0_9BACT|nr:hypothetical protein [Butyricimonas paravirosa]